MNNETRQKQHQSGYIDCHGNILTQFADLDHPQGKIILMDGRELECYPKESAEGGFAPDKVQLDTTGQYLALGKKPEPMKHNDEEEKQLKKLFLDNAFYLLAHRERILSDSRMFLTPITVQSGLAYTGMGGFRNPTVGVYLEWWASCDGAMRTSEDGGRSLIYRLAGSPLSGANHCSEVLENGESRLVKLSLFIDYWLTFMKVNKRYTAAKRDYRSYSLHQLLEILRHEDNDVSGYAQNLNEAFLQHEIYRLNKRVEKLDQQSQMWYEKYTDTLMKLYDKKIREYYNEYKILESDSQTEINQLREQKHALKASLKRGDTDNITYQRTIIPINKRIEEINFNLTQFRYEHLYETFPGEDDISFDIIKRYIYNNKLKK